MSSGETIEKEVLNEWGVDVEEEEEEEEVEDGHVGECDSESPDKYSRYTE